MKKYIFIFLFLIIFITFSSCDKNEKNKDEDLTNYYELFIELNGSDELKKEIAAKFYAQNEYEMEWWNNPKIKEVNEITCADDLRLLMIDHSGYRIYGMYDDTYIICNFITSWTYMERGLCYNNSDNIIFDKFNTPFCRYHSTYLYTNGTLKLVDLFVDSKKKLDVSPSASILSKKEVSKLKKINDSYNEYYFKRFLNKEELISNDYYSCYNRLKNGNNSNNENIKSTYLETTTSNI